MPDLSGKVALVTGASRGVGKGIALGLGEAGATVYITGRTEKDGSGRLPGSIVTTTEAVTVLGGKGFALRCDHRQDAQVEAVFRQIMAEAGGIDILVNKWFDLSNSESPQFNGRAVAALAVDPNLMQKSGQVLITASLALEYGFTDIDGKQPRPVEGL